MNIQQVKKGDVIKHPYFQLNAIVTHIGHSESSGDATDFIPVKIAPIRGSGPDYNEQTTSLTLAFHEDENGEFSYAGLLKVN